MSLEETKSLGRVMVGENENGIIFYLPPSILMRLYLAKSSNVPRVLSSTMWNTCQNNTCMTSFHEFSPRVFHPTSSWALWKSFALFEYETSTQISAGFVIPLGRRFGAWQSHHNRSGPKSHCVPGLLGRVDTFGDWQGTLISWSQDDRNPRELNIFMKSQAYDHDTTK
jgi:hypothetical protein